MTYCSVGLAFETRVAMNARVIKAKPLYIYIWVSQLFFLKDILNILLFILCHSLSVTTLGFICKSYSLSRFGPIRISFSKDMHFSIYIYKLISWSLGVQMIFMCLSLSCHISYVLETTMYKRKREERDKHIKITWTLGNQNTFQTHI